jgi:hypothetical protein
MKMKSVYPLTSKNEKRLVQDYEIASSRRRCGKEAGHEAQVLGEVHA